MPRLIVLRSAGAARQVNLPVFPCVIGRAPTSDLVLDHAQVSRTHAVLEAVGNAVQIRDMQSNNGIHVNGERVQSCVLANGDEVKVGGFLIRYLSSGGVVRDADALRLVTVPGKLTELDLRKLAPPSPRV